MTVGTPALSAAVSWGPIVLGLTENRPIEVAFDEIALPKACWIWLSCPWLGKVCAVAPASLSASAVDFVACAMNGTAAEKGISAAFLPDTFFAGTGGSLGND